MGFIFKVSEIMNETTEALSQWALPELLEAWIALQMPGNFTPDAGEPIYSSRDLNLIGLAITKANERIKELEAADPWTYITADPDTLPPVSMKKKFYLVSFVYDPGTEEEWTTNSRCFFNGETFFSLPGKIPVPLGVAYAWQPWPESAPLREV